MNKRLLQPAGKPIPGNLKWTANIVTPVDQLTVQHKQRRLNELRGERVLVISRIAPGRLSECIPHANGDDASQNKPNKNLFSCGFPVQRGYGKSTDDPENRQFISDKPCRRYAADQTVECESDEKCSANGDDRAFVEGALRYFFPRDFGFRQRLFLLMRGWFMCWLAPLCFWCFLGFLCFW